MYNVKWMIVQSFRVERPWISRKRLPGPDGHAHHALHRALGVRVPVHSARRPTAQPGPSHPQPGGGRPCQQGQARPGGAGSGRLGGVTVGPEVVPSQGPIQATLRHQPTMGQQEHERGGGRRRNRPCPGLIHRGKGVLGQLMRVLLQRLGPKGAYARGTEVGRPRADSNRRSLP